MFLILRKRIYHFRLRVPAKLIPVLGRNEIKASLQTSNRRHARELASRLAAGCRSIALRLNHTPEAILMELDSTAINEIIRNHIREVVAHFTQSHAVSGDHLQHTLDKIDNILNNTKAALKFGLHHGWMKGTLEQVISNMGLEVDNDQRKELAFQLAQAHVQGLQKAKDTISGKEPLNLDSESQPTKQEDAKSENGPPLTTLETLINQYRDHQLSTGKWRPGVERDANPKLNALLSYFKPETKIGAITVDMLRGYVTLLQALPPSYSMMKLYRDKPLHELNPKELIERHPKQLDVTTVRDYLAMCRNLFEYAVGLDLIDKNPCPSLLIPKKKTGSAREQTATYTIDQLHELFKPERFMPWARYGGNLNPAKLWVPLLMLCTACRLEEICGLRKADLQNSDDTLCLDIVAHEYRPLKNDNSARIIPLPPTIESALKEYADSLPPESMLFPQLAIAHGKWSHNFSKTWGRYVRDKASIKDPKISPAHSFRHFTLDLLYKALVPVQIIKQLSGHSLGGSELEQRYVKGLAVATLKEHCVPVIEGAVGPVLSKLLKEDLSFFFD